jgi:hypothetical protein
MSEMRPNPDETAPRAGIDRRSGMPVVPDVHRAGMRLVDVHYGVKGSHSCHFSPINILQVFRPGRWLELAYPHELADRTNRKELPLVVDANVYRMIAFDVNDLRCGHAILQLRGLGG